VDRAELILDIFATRARTAEAKMQVELAQLETDRRLINHRIKLLKERLRDVQKGRVVQRQSRQREFKSSLVGYTNAGKSSILSSLTGSKDVFIEDRLFATLDPLTREVDVGEAKVLVTDTVGFIRKLPHHLVASFRATLEETAEADLLLHVIDASQPTWEEQRIVVEQVLEELGVGDRPRLLVFNKVDLLDEETLLALQERIGRLVKNAVFVSAVQDGGLEPLRRALGTAIRARRPLAEIRLSAGDGKLLAEIHRSGEVIDQRTDGDQLVLRARVDEALAGRLRRAGAEVTAGIATPT
jgi:GTP-binding protein HflX